VVQKLAHVQNDEGEGENTSVNVPYNVRKDITLEI
jgi:hypothetical protein